MITRRSTIVILIEFELYFCLLQKPLPCLGLILISNDISGLIVAFVFGHFASKGKIRWLFFGVIVNLIANMMQSGTQLFVKVWDDPVLRDMTMLLVFKYDFMSFKFNKGRNFRIIIRIQI